MSTECRSDLQWNKLTPFPLTYFSKPFPINNHEFVAAASKKGENAGGIYKFDTHTNEWSKIFDQIEFINIYSSAYDNTQRLLHTCDISDYPSKMVTFDLNTKNKITKHTVENKYKFQLIFIENKLHQICNNGNHYVYNSTKQFQKVCSFKPFQCLDVGHRTIYLKSQKCTLLFGGYGRPHYYDSIYTFNDAKWKELNIKMPIKVSDFGLVATKNEQYIIILGGLTIEHECSNDIFVYDTRKSTFFQSKIKCPTTRPTYAIMINNSSHAEIATFGFVNDCFKSEHFSDTQLLPQYLIKIICCYYCDEKIHLLEEEIGKHWEMNVDYILQ